MLIEVIKPSLSLFLEVLTLDSLGRFEGVPSSP